MSNYYFYYSRYKCYYAGLGSVVGASASTY